MKKYMALMPLLLFYFGAFGQSKEMEGKILSRHGNTVQVSLTSSCPNSLSGQYRLEKYFTQEILGSQATGWLTIGSISLVSCQNGKLTLNVNEEKSEILVNGEKIDHFKAGNIVKVIAVDAIEAK